MGVLLHRNENALYSSMLALVYNIVLNSLFQLDLLLAVTWTQLILCIVRTTHCFKSLVQ